MLDGTSPRVLILQSGLCHRFNAVQRGYKYFIPQHGEYDIRRMQQAASYFVGEHDFRNFCKADVRHVSNFRRTISDFQIQPEPGVAVGGSQLWSLSVKGSAFLWHQVSTQLLACSHTMCCNRHTHLSFTTSSASLISHEPVNCARFLVCTIGKPHQSQGYHDDASWPLLVQAAVLCIELSPVIATIWLQL